MKNNKIAESREESSGIDQALKMFVSIGEIVLISTSANSGGVHYLYSEVLIFVIQEHCKHVPSFISK